MIFKGKELKLIAICFLYLRFYMKKLRFTCQQFSNNANSLFTDQEIMIIYLFVAFEQHHSQNYLFK